LNGYESGLIPNEILLNGDHTTLENMLSLASSREEREANIEAGVEIFNEFMRMRGLRPPNAPQLQMPGLPDMPPKTGVCG
jgi:hypothetical protein